MGQIKGTLEVKRTHTNFQIEVVGLDGEQPAHPMIEVMIDGKVYRMKRVAFSLDEAGTCKALLKELNANMGMLSTNLFSGSAEDMRTVTAFKVSGRDDLIKAGLIEPQPRGEKQ